MKTLATVLALALPLLLTVDAATAAEQPDPVPLTQTIPHTVYLLMESGRSTKTIDWHAESIWLSANECRDHAPPKGTMDTHGAPVEWKCVRFRQ